MDAQVNRLLKKLTRSLFGIIGPVKLIHELY